MRTNRKSILCLLPILLAVSQIGVCQLSPPANDLSRPQSPVLQHTASSFQTLARLPLGFEPNRGQTDPRVRFVARGRGYTAFLTPEETVVALRGSAVLRLRFAGAGTTPSMEGEDVLPGVRNYLRGQDRSRWITNVPAHARVIVREVYPGIDVVYRGTEGQLEYDFLVQPGADPAGIALALSGHEGLGLDAAGNLIIRTAAASMIHKAPLVYQESDGKKRPVAGRYAIGADGLVRIALGCYDAARPLVIDPILVCGKTLGGSNFDSVSDIAVDDQHNIYMAGSTNSTDFPGQTTLTVAPDAFVVKLASTGDLEFQTILAGGAGDGFDSAGTLALEPAVCGGNLCVAGTTWSTDFPTTSGAYSQQSAGDADLFVVRLDAEDGTLLYGTYIGGPRWERCTRMALGPVVSEGEPPVFYPTIYLTGEANAGFPTTSGAFQEEHNSEANPDFSDPFVVKLAPVGSGATDLLYSTYIGSRYDEWCFGIAVDSGGNACITGQTKFVIKYPPVFPTTANAYQPMPPKLNKSSTQYFAFVSVINPGGNGSDDLLYSSFLHEASMSLTRGYRVAVDDWGRLYVAGSGHDGLPTTVGAFDRTYNGGDAFKVQDIFLMILDMDEPGTGGLVYGTYIGGYGGEDPYDMHVEGASEDDPGAVLLTGWTAWQDPPPEETAPVLPFPTAGEGFNVQQVGSGPPTWGDAYLLKLQPSGSGSADLIYSFLFGGTDVDVAAGLAVGPDDDIYIAGESASSDRPTTLPPAGPLGLRDGFVARIRIQSFPYPTNLQATAVPGCQINLTWSDNSIGEDGFAIEYSLDGLHWEEVHRTPSEATGWQHTDLVANTTYQYRVRAFKTAGYSGYSSVASATAIVSGGGSDATANADVPVAGTVSGSYTDTHSADDVYESIKEQDSGGKPSSRYSYLEHKWTFNVAGGSSVALHLQAHRTDSGDGDALVFAYSTDDSTYIDVGTVTKTSDDGQYQIFALPASLSGTVYIRVRDTDRTPGNRSQDTIFVDHVFIRSE